MAERKIKVAEFVSRLVSGGVESMLLNYLGHFSHPEDFDIHIVTQDINDARCVEQFRRAGYTVDIVTHKRKSIKKNVIEVFRLLRQEHFDVVHSHMTLTNFYVLILAWLTGTRQLISHSHNAFISDSPIKRLLWFFLKKINQLVSNVWIACGYDAGVFLFGKRAMHNGKVTLLPNAIDLDKFKFDEHKREVMRSKLAIHKTEFVVGHIGRFMKQKNHKYLVDVFHEFLRFRPDSKLLLVGTGELEKNIHEYVDKLGLRNKVIFAGSVQNTWDYYQAMDAFVLPSKYEGLPVVSIEAQASDLPILMSSNVDHSCAITNNVSFLSVDNNPEVWVKAILHFVSRKRGDSVIAQIKKAHYDIHQESQRLENIYRQRNDK